MSFACSSDASTSVVVSGTVRVLNVRGSARMDIARSPPRGTFDPPGDPAAPVDAGDPVDLVAGD
jgi:hypothetical protein